MYVCVGSSHPAVEDVVGDVAVAVPAVFHSNMEVLWHRIEVQGFQTG